MLQQHQGQQGVELGARQQGPQQPGQPDRLAGEFDPDRVGAGTRRVPGGERQVDDRRHGVEPVGERPFLGESEPDPATTSLRLARVSRAAMVDSDTRKSRAMSAVETPSTNRRVSAVGRLRSQRRVTAEEDQPESFVVHLVSRIEHHPLGVGLQLGVDDQQRFLAYRDRLGAQSVDDPASSGGEQPGTRVGGLALTAPALGGGREGLGETVLGQVQAAELRDQQREQASPVLAERRSSASAAIGWASGHGVATTGRISTEYQDGSNAQSSVI